MPAPSSESWVRVVPEMGCLSGESIKSSYEPNLALDSRHLELGEGGLDIRPAKADDRTAEEIVRDSTFPHEPLHHGDGTHLEAIAQFFLRKKFRREDIGVHFSGLHWRLLTVFIALANSTISCPKGHHSNELARSETRIGGIYSIIDYSASLVI